MYEEIFATSLKLDGFKKIGFTEPWGRYVICLKVDEDNIYYGAEGIIGVYNKITKETVCEPFEDHQDNHFDIDDKYVYYSRGNNIAIKEKNSWNLIKEINSETQIRAVFVDNEFIYFNDGEIKFHQIPKTSLLIKK